MYPVWVSLDMQAGTRGLLVATRVNGDGCRELSPGGTEQITAWASILEKFDLETIMVSQFVETQMRIIARRTLREFVESHAGRKDQSAAKAALDAWFDEVGKAEWASSADVKRRYATASIVNAEWIVFNVKGNDYRLVVAVDFEKGIVWIKWIGTHKAYDKIDAAEVSHGD